MIFNTVFGQVSVFYLEQVAGGRRPPAAPLTPTRHGYV